MFAGTLAGIALVKSAVDGINCRVVTREPPQCGCSCLHMRSDHIIAY